MLMIRVDNQWHISSALNGVCFASGQYGMFITSENIRQRSAGMQTGRYLWFCGVGKKLQNLSVVETEHP